jgi:hypothetical protein
MSAIFFIDYISLVFQVVLNYCVAHGVAPISAENVEAAFLNLLMRAAPQAAMS